jgi:hypothetical protein
MKKIVAIILSLALLLGCAAAFAETAEKAELGTVNVNGAYKIQGKIPEGYRLAILNQSSTAIVAMLMPADSAKPTVTISVAYAEDWADTEKLDDVSEEDLAEIEASFETEDAVNIEYRETGHGTKLMVVTEAVDQADFVDIYTIYKGFEHEFVMTPGSEALTEENIQMLIDFITEIDFVEA